MVLQLYSVLIPEVEWLAFPWLYDQINVAGLDGSVIIFTRGLGPGHGIVNQIQVISHSPAQSEVKGETQLGMDDIHCINNLNLSSW